MNRDYIVVLLTDDGNGPVLGKCLKGDSYEDAVEKGIALVKLQGASVVIAREHLEIDGHYSIDATWSVCIGLLDNEIDERS